MNLLGYTIHLPCFLYAMKNNESILPELANKSKVLLFRWVTICDFGVGEVDTLFKDVLKSLKNKKTDKETLELFDSLMKKVDDEVFFEAFENFETENSKIMKYIMTKLHIKDNGASLVPNFLQVDLEHILPQQLDIWRDAGDMERFSMPYKRWVYSVGNVALWEKSKNRSQKNDRFKSKKVGYADSIFPETQELALVCEWTGKAITDRASSLANKALTAWGS
ncbi:HNH endonuclease family protein [Vibrio sp. 10N.222.55.F12]